jgi:two-component system KDP operon response regulator KdpE
MSQTVILIIEDDRTIMNFISISLRAKQYDCLCATTGKNGLALLNSEQPDIVLLDLGLPDMDGIAVLKGIRAVSHIPVIVVTARGQEDEKAKLLDAGADDYICKPFSMIELSARIRVALRHSQTQKTGSRAISRFSVNEMDLDFDKHRVNVSGEEVHLTPNEYRILELLARNAGKVLTYSVLSQEIWGVAMEKDINSIRVFVTGLRHKIEKDPAHPRYIKTEVGVGYRLADE